MSAKPRSSQRVTRANTMAVFSRSQKPYPLRSLFERECHSLLMHRPRGGRLRVPTFYIDRAYHGSAPMELSVVWRLWKISRLRGRRRMDILSVLGVQTASHPVH